MTKFRNPYAPIAAFGAFAGKCFGTLDAIDALEEADKQQLEQIMRKISANAEQQAAEAKSDELGRDRRRIAEAFAKGAAEFEGA